jgi:hypothetical protein
MAAPTLKVVYCLMCDDVRLEVYNKETIVGVYATGISLPSLPWFIYVCVWMAVIWSGEGEVGLEVRILDPKFTEIGQTQGRAHAAQQGRESSLTFRGVIFTVETEGIHTIQWRAANGGWETIKSIPIALARS